MFDSKRPGTSILNFGDHRCNLVALRGPSIVRDLSAFFLRYTAYKVQSKTCGKQGRANKKGLLSRLTSGVNSKLLFACL